MNLFCKKTDYGNTAILRLHWSYHPTSFLQPLQITVGVCSADICPIHKSPLPKCLLPPAVGGFQLHLLDLWDGFLEFPQTIPGTFNLIYNKITWEILKWKNSHVTLPTQTWQLTPMQRWPSGRSGNIPNWLWEMYIDPGTTAEQQDAATFLPSTSIKSWCYFYG